MRLKNTGRRKDRKVILKHVALFCSSEEKSDKFYEELLNLKKKGSKILSSELSKQIFNLDSEYKMINYIDNDIQFEIFINPEKRVFENKIEHICLKVDNFDAFIEKCRASGIKVKQIPKTDSSLITFISDYDGNLFEIK